MDEEITQTPEEIEEPTAPRKLQELLLLESYQGMSDEEIEILLTYRVEQALISDEVAVRNAAIEEQMQAIAADAETAIQNSEAVLQSIMERTGVNLPLIEVVDNDA